jgi:CO/xanthine dehydrogenase FAD-binding subunit
VKTFEFGHATSIGDAIASVAATGGRYYAGGTNLLDLMKNGVETPTCSSTSADWTCGRSPRPSRVA